MLSLICTDDIYPTFIISTASLASIMKSCKEWKTRTMKICSHITCILRQVWSLISTVSRIDSTSALSTSQSWPVGQGGDVLYEF